MACGARALAPWVQRDGVVVDVCGRCNLRQPVRPALAPRAPLVASTAPTPVAPKAAPAKRVPAVAPARRRARDRSLPRGVKSDAVLAAVPDTWATARDIAATLGQVDPTEINRTSALIALLVREGAIETRRVAPGEVADKRVKAVYRRVARQAVV